jgi:hypothetical protein
LIIGGTISFLENYESTPFANNDQTPNGKFQKDIESISNDIKDKIEEENKKEIIVSKEEEQIFYNNLGTQIEGFTYIIDEQIKVYRYFYRQNYQKSCAYMS